MALSETGSFTFASGDARRLLSLSRGEGYFDAEYKITPSDTTIILESGLTPFWDYIDVYLDSLKTEGDPREKTFQGQGRSVIMKPMDESEYLRIRGLVFGYISRISGFDDKKVSSLSVSKNGVLTVHQINGKMIKIDLVSGWNMMRLPKEQLPKAEKKTREEIENLKESLNTERYFGGSLLVTYAPTVIIGAGAASMGYSTLSQVGSAIGHRIKKVTIKTEDGSMKTVKITDNSSVDNKDAVRDIIVKLLQKQGIIFDTARRVGYEPSWKAFIEARETIKSISYEEWKKQSGQDISRAEFRKMRGHLLDNMNNTHAEYSASLQSGSPLSFQERLKGFSRKLLSLGTLQHVFFGSIFFSKFAQYQNALTFAEGVADTALFMAGNKAAGSLAKILSTLGPAGKVAHGFSGILGGGLAVHYGHEAWDKIMDGKREFWKVGSRKGAGVYTDGSSRSLNMIFGGWITGMLDSHNQGLEKDGFESSTYDIGIKRIENIPFKKYGIDHRLPEMTWFQYNINLGTSPWDWVRQSPGRTIDGWNNQIDVYKLKLTKAISQAVGYYQSNQGPFAYPEMVQEKGGKEKLLEWYLYELLMAGGVSTAFGGMQKNIVEGVLSEVQRGWRKDSPENVAFLARQQVSFMKIDNDFIQNRLFELDLRRQEMMNAMQTLGEYITPAQMQYISSILDRILTNREIVDLNGGKWKKTETFGISGNEFTPSQEVQWFDELLNDNRKMSHGGEKVGSYFVLLLDQMLEYKRESEFIREVKSGNKKGVQWGV